MGWRWSQYIVAIIDAVVFVLLFFTFEETMFPRFLFSPNIVEAISSPRADAETIVKGADNDAVKIPDGGDFNLRAASHVSVDQALIRQFSKRSYPQLLKPWTHYPENKTRFWQYFRRPFFLLGFPNVVIVCHLSEPVNDHSLTLRRLVSFSPSVVRPVLSPSTPSPRYLLRSLTTSAPPPPASYFSPP